MKSMNPAPDGSVRSRPTVAQREVNLGDDLVLAPPPSRSRSAMALPPGWLLVSPDGRAHTPGRSAIVNAMSGVQQELDRVIP